jgi:hypothetical protein
MSTELIKELEAELKQEVDEHNTLVQNIEQANQQLFVRRGRIQHIQETLQRLSPETPISQNGNREAVEAVAVPEQPEEDRID